MPVNVDSYPFLLYRVRFVYGITKIESLMRTLIHEGSDFQSELNISMARYRYQVFVKQLGWILPCDDDGMELDKYDRSDTVYVTALDELGGICGCARLLPTVRPYLLKDLFPTLLPKDMPAPVSPHVWELSRFAARPGLIDSYLSRSPAGRSVSPLEWAVRPLLASVVECAARLGARQLVGVTFLSMERLFRRLGVRAYRGGPEQNIDGKRVVACWIDIDRQTCEALGIDSAPREVDRLRVPALDRQKWLPAIAPSRSMSEQHTPVAAVTA